MANRKGDASFFEKVKHYFKNRISRVQFMALCEGLEMLNEKGVACFFINRVGKKEGFEYSDSAKIRMANGTNFACMLDNITEYENDLKEIVGDKYSPEYIQKLSKVSQIILRGNKYAHGDQKEELVNIVAGRRVTKGMPAEYKNNIYVYGRCGVFGYAVEDGDNMPSILQGKLLDKGYSDYRVINCGLWGGTDKIIFHNFIQDIAKMKTGDIVVFYEAPIRGKMGTLSGKGLWNSDITEQYHEYPEAKYCFFDRPGHMNHQGYNNVAELILKELEDKKFAQKKIENRTNSKAHYEKYLKRKINQDFYNELNEYLKMVDMKYKPDHSKKDCGAIVMNCNPFTLGHRYLIEEAKQEVDYLYIFVVEENRSFFSFEDRFEMVQRGVADLENVIVIPSGKFMISTVTFPEYFLKDFVKEKDFDVSMDLEIFAADIAPYFNVVKRFAGEEPLDPVTNNYNRTMEMILPEYGLQFCEIPRLKSEDDNVINATRIRKLLSEKQYEEIRKYVPESTYDILKERYMN